mgnify:CR=1 FL=1
MEKRRVVITGLGTVNPLGNNTADSWAAARAGKCGIGPITQFDASEFKCKLAGEVKGFDPETVVDKKEARKMARFTLLALGAAAEAIQDSGIDCEAEAENIGVIVSSGIGGLPTIEEQHSRGEEKGMEKVSPYFVPMAIANMAAAQIAIRFGLKGMCTCPVTACAGGTNAVGDAFHRIRDGYEPVMVCGGAESCISPLGIGGFTSMKALSTAADPDAASLPFDARRGGFVMGEGSGVLVLEELEHAKARGAHIYAEVVGYGANCGTMGESSVPDIIEALEQEGYYEEAQNMLRIMEENKYEAFENRPYPYGSEYAYDNTAEEGVFVAAMLAQEYGFESDPYMSPEERIKALDDKTRACRGVQPLWYYYANPVTICNENWWNFQYLSLIHISEPTRH